MISAKRQSAFRTSPNPNVTNSAKSQTLEMEKQAKINGICFFLHFPWNINKKMYNIEPNPENSI